MVIVYNLTIAKFTTPLYGYINIETSEQDLGINVNSVVYYLEQLSLLFLSTLFCDVLRSHRDTKSSQVKKCAAELNIPWHYFNPNKWGDKSPELSTRIQGGTKERKLGAHAHKFVKVNQTTIYNYKTIIIILKERKLPISKF